MATGKRIRGASLPQVKKGTAAGGRGQGRRQQRKTGTSRRMVQLLVSAAILLVVVTVKFTMPDVAYRYGGELLRLMGEDTDFAAAFSAVGRAVGGEGLAEAARDAYTAVFGKETISVEQQTDRNAVAYGADTTPDTADMLQRVLDFSYQKPVEGTVTSSFGFRDHPVAGTERFHYGLDIACEKGTVIQAFADGTVTAVANSSELGNYLMLSHSNGYSTLYAHCSRVNASVGQSVRMGDPIAEVGDTGDATGDHLHFELHHDNTYLNPIYYVA